MNANDYQKWARTTAIYPEAGTGALGELMYLGLGLAGEAAEVANKVKKLYRDTSEDMESERATALKDGTRAELGDIMWYMANICTALGTDLEAVMQHNHDKLESRKSRDQLTGDGDNR